MEYSKDIIKSINKAAEKAGKARNEFVTPEHFLYALCDLRAFSSALNEIGSDPKALQAEVDEYLQKMEKVPEGIKYELNTSNQFSQMFSYAEMQARNAAAEIIDVPHFVHAVLTLQDSFAGAALESYIGGRLGDFTAVLLSSDPDANSAEGEFEEDEPIPFGTFLEPDPKEKFVGREEEITKIARILCRMENNNVLLVADHGVGKSALIRELCRRTQSESFPLRVLGMRFFNVKPSLIMAGTEMRGALEKNIQLLMERIKMEGDIIVVIEDFHTLFSTGSSNSSSDAASILSNYLTDNDVPFIATTTFQDIKKVQGKNSSADRYFTRIDLDEPTRDDAVTIVKALSSRYSKFHGIKYAKPALEYIVDLSIRHLPGCLPGKAISLMDDCGAWVEAHPDEVIKSIDKALVEKIAAEISGKRLSDSDNDPLDGISERIKNHIFGQDKAVDALCTSLLISKAGLSNPQKPLGSFLFIGPTGVGKTQLARTLASELHENLVRFDMSEYAEKHTVSKFIGSPAGYVGYDDGGLLTDAVRKNPGCVLLLDEIEKAHQDIYNLLLQIMDYGTLTDSRGQKADFRGVVLIMTSNAGARFASQAAVGFSRKPNPGGVMEGEAKKVFAPEFLNRLTSTVVFNALDEGMAIRVLDSKIGDLSSMLKGKNVTLEVTDDAKKALLQEGFSPEYGAREIERVVDSRLKPLLVKEILFGKLKKGGKATVDFKDTEFTLSSSRK